MKRKSWDAWWSGCWGGGSGVGRSLARQVHHRKCKFTYMPWRDDPCAISDQSGRSKHLRHQRDEQLYILHLMPSIKLFSLQNMIIEY